MSILWCGGEDIDFPNGVAVAAMGTQAGHYRSGYARGFISMQNRPTIYTNAFLGGAITSGWLSVQSFWSAITGSGRIGLIKVSSAPKGVYIGFSAVSGSYLRLAIYKYDGTTWTAVVSEAGYSYLTSSLTKIDLQISNFGASAHVRLYLNGSEIATIDSDADLSISGISDLDGMQLSATPNNTIDMSEIIVADEDTRTFGLVTLPPNQAGSTNEWDGTYADVDELSQNDADVVYTNVVDEIFQCGLSALPSGSFSIKAVRDVVRACKTADATPTGIKLGVRTNGENNHGSSQTLNTAWNTYERLMGQNPVTSDHWTQGEIDALQHSQQAA